MDGLCDVPGCRRQTFMGWRPLTERMGRKICEQHWRRHKDQQDSFDLFEAFGFKRPAGIPKPKVKKDIASYASGREREPKPVKGKVSGCRDCEQSRESDHRYCEKCGNRRKAESNRTRQRRYKAEKGNAFARPLCAGRILGVLPATPALTATVEIVRAFCEVDVHT
jgi:hypothetical protein